MEKIYAIIWKGKGHQSTADFFQPIQFDSWDDFEKFKAENEDLESKYWTLVDQITFGQEEYEIPFRD